MKFRFLTKVTPHKRFYFVPRFYDERKERLDAMTNAYRDEQHEGAEELDYRKKEAFRQNLQTQWGRGKHRQTDQKKSNLRIALIIVLLLGIAYLILKGSGNVPDTIVHQLD